MYTPKIAVLHDATTTEDTAPGLALDVAGYSTVAVTIKGSADADCTVDFQGSQDGSRYVALMGQQRSTLALATGITLSDDTATVWTVPVGGLRLFRCLVTAGVAETWDVTVTATAVRGTVPAWKAA